MTPLDTLTATVQTATFRAEEPLHLPAYKGSTFRGALGYAFKQVSCALRREHCDTCLVKQRCAYSVCFETPVPEGAEIMRRYPKAPHPFVLELPLDDRQEYGEGDELAVRLLLTGKAREHLPYFVYAFDEMGTRGVGRDRGRITLSRVESRQAGENVLLYTEQAKQLTGSPFLVDHVHICRRVEELRDKAVRVVFETPVRVKNKNQLSERCDMDVLAPALVRRINTLAYFFCGAPWDKNSGRILDAAGTVETLDSRVTWMDWTRYSARQDTTMQLGGFVGEATFSPVPEPLLVYLCWGEILHLGKASAFGLGKYRMDVA